MEYTNLNSLFEDCKQINSKQNYWMVRTMGGKYYQDFLKNNYIAIGYNEISLDFITGLPTDESIAKRELQAKLSSVYPTLKNLGSPTGQLLHFVRKIKKGDIVIIPSEKSAHAAIGIIDGGNYEERETKSDFDTSCRFYKRRKVKWITAYRKSRLSPSFQLMFNYRSALCNVTNYAQYIDSVTNDFYIKNEMAHLVLKIKTRKEVDLQDFCDLASLKILIQNFASTYGGCSETFDINMKVQMESPGWLRLSSKNIFSLAFIGLLIFALNGGGIEYKNEKTGANFKMFSDGLFKSFADYIQKEADTELVKSATRAIDTLKIDDPKDLQPVIELMKVKNEGRIKY